VRFYSRVRVIFSTPFRPVQCRTSSLYSFLLTLPYSSCSIPRCPYGSIAFHLHFLHLFTRDRGCDSLPTILLPLFTPARLLLWRWTFFNGNTRVFYATLCITACTRVAHLRFLSRRRVRPLSVRQKTCSPSRYSERWYVWVVRCIQFVQPEWFSRYFDLTKQCKQTQQNFHKGFDILDT